MKKKILGLIGIFLSLAVACDDLEDKPALPDNGQETVHDDGTAEMYVLCEGLFNLNNSTLARYSFETDWAIRQTIWIYTEESCMSW